MTRKKKSGPVYSLLLFTKAGCNPCAVAKPQVTRAATALTLGLEEIDAMSGRGGDLVLGLNVLAVPTLVLLKDGKKLHDFSGSAALSEKVLTDRITKLIERDSK